MLLVENSGIGNPGQEKTVGFGLEFTSQRPGAELVITVKADLFDVTFRPLINQKNQLHPIFTGFNRFGGDAYGIEAFVPVESFHFGHTFAQFFLVQNTEGVQGYLFE